MVLAVLYDFDGQEKTNYLAVNTLMLNRAQWQVRFLELRHGRVHEEDPVNVHSIL